MTTMAPYYSHDSAVGPVFDVADYSQFKAVKMAFICFGAGCLLLLGAAYFWNPDWMVSEPIFADAHQVAKDLRTENPWSARIGVGSAVVFALLCYLGTISYIVNALSGEFYVRVGEGGVSLRVPDGFLRAYQRDLSWEEVAKLKVVQEKQLGALSRNAGNTGGELRLRTHDGYSKDIRLDDFRQDAWLIYQRIEEAMGMRPAEWQ